MSQYLRIRILSLFRTKDLYNSGVKINYLHTVRKQLAAEITNTISGPVKASMLMARDPLIIEWSVSGEEDDQKKEYVLSKLEAVVEHFDFFSTFFG